MKIIKTYSELISIPSFWDRFNYLKLNGNVGERTFGGNRYLNQLLYKEPFWRRVRREVILRDEGFDLAHDEHPIYGSIYVHHINPIDVDDILKGKSCVFDLENLISVSFKTHTGIHYGTSDDIPRDLVCRTENDTCPWKKQERR